MKLNPLEWSEIKANEEIQARSGVLRLRGSAPFAVLVSAYGTQSVQFVAASADIEVPEGTSFKVIPSAPGGLVFLKDTPSRVYRMTGEKFTNIDRLPQESGTVAEVTKALRMLKLEERAMVRRIREERDLAQAVLDAARAKDEALIEDEPEPEPEPAKEAAK